jgi:hypothetical protein
MRHPSGRRFRSNRRDASLYSTGVLPGLLSGAEREATLSIAGNLTM